MASKPRLALLCVCAFALAGCRSEVVYRDLTAKQANEIVVALRGLGIEATTTASGDRSRTSSVSVPADQVSSALQTMARLGLPRRQTKQLTDVLPKDSWMTSKAQENVEIAEGVGQGLAATLMEIGGVHDARVHVVLAEKNAIGQIVTQPSASVLVTYDPTLIGGEFVDDFKSLVANSVAGLLRERVSVTMVPTQGAGVLAPGLAAALQPGWGSTLRWYFGALVLGSLLLFGALAARSRVDWHRLGERLRIGERLRVGR